jgi:hypothetical protein
LTEELKKRKDRANLNAEVIGSQEKTDLTTQLTD